MIRELKFRAWDKRKNEWFKSPFALIPTQPGWRAFPLEKPDEVAEMALAEMDKRKGDIFFDASDYSLVDWANFYFENLIVEQYTGFKDKNGKEIYEGDILSFGGHGKILVSYSIAAIETCYGQGSYGTDSFSGFKISGYWGDIANSEVIGNSHENPELLKGSV